MRDELYFITILAEAVQRPNRRAAIEAAIKTICDLGREPQHGTGYQQWLQFLAAAAPAPSLTELETLVEAVEQLLLDQQPHESGHGLPPAHQTVTEDSFDAQALLPMRRMAQRPDLASLLVRREGLEIGSLPIRPLELKYLKSIRPGFYSILLDTGRTLWSGDVADTDVVWHLAFPRRPLTWAADSTLPAVRPTRIIPVGIGNLVIGVYPGVEAGSMRLLKLRQRS